MTTEVENQPQAETAEASLSFLDRAIEATTQTPADTTKELFSVLAEQALSGTVTWDKNVTKTIENAIVEIDKKLSKQLSKVMQENDFQKLEGSWRGLQKLVKESDLGRSLKIKMVDYTKDELLDQFEDAPAIDRSPLFNAVYQGEYGTAGGEPYGTFIGDYEFSAKDEDVALLRYMGEVAAACHAPFIAAANAEMFEFNDFTTFEEGKPVAAGFDSPAYAAWNSFRESDDARYVTLTLPRTLARLPYGEKGLGTKLFSYEELNTDQDGNPNPSSNDELVWSNAAYELGLKMTQAFTAYGWCTAIRGLDNGGKVENLPNLTYKTEAGDLVQQCPTEVNLTDEREKELSDLASCHWFTTRTQTTVCSSAVKQRSNRRRTQIQMQQQTQPFQRVFLTSWQVVASLTT